MKLLVCILELRMRKGTLRAVRHCLLWSFRTHRTVVPYVSVIYFITQYFVILIFFFCIQQKKKKKMKQPPQKSNFKSNSVIYFITQYSVIFSFFCIRQILHIKKKMKQKKKVIKMKLIEMKH